MEKVRLGDVSKLINGDRGRNYPSQVDITDDGEVPFVNAGHLNGRNIDFSEMNYISQVKYDKLSSGKFQKGDILYCLRGSLGKKAIVNDDINGAIASSLVIIRPNFEMVSGEYLMFALDSPFIKEQLIKANNGSSQPNLSASSVREYEIELPDLSVQKEVVKKLIKIRNIVDARKQELQLFDKLIKARFVEMFGKFRPSVTISRYVSELRGGKSLASAEECKNKVLKTGAATFGWFDPSQYKYLPKDYIPLPEHKVESGDVIISRMNTPELVGACSYVFDAPEDMYYPDRLWKVILKQDSNPIFLWQLLWDEDVRRQIKEQSGGTSGTMNNISKPKLLSIKCIDAPIELQNQFADFVKQVDKSKVVVQKHLEKAQLLFDSLMQEYFG